MANMSAGEKNSAGEGKKPPVRILIIEQDAASFRAMADWLTGEFGTGCVPERAQDRQAATTLLREGQTDIVLADLDSLARQEDTAEAAISRICRLAPAALVVALSARGSISGAVSAMRAGAHDFMTKPLNATNFARHIFELGLRHGRVQALSGELVRTRQSGFEGFVGTSEPMRAIYEQIERAAASQAPVFITGESGTGKQLCARALHRRSNRADGPLVTINCSAIPGEQMEGEIFGGTAAPHGNADPGRIGALERAAGGILFLDDIGEMELGLQAKLLRFLQSGETRQSGESAPRPLDVRIICSTSSSPMHLIAERKLREDLFYRLHVLPIHLPPLRQRPGDILTLAQAFADSCCAEENRPTRRFSAEAASLLVSLDWPGNVRQLQNAVRRMVVMFDGCEIDASMLRAAYAPAVDPEPGEPETIGASVFSPSAQPLSAPSLSSPLPLAAIEPMWQQEKRIIEQALSRYRGNIAMAAAALEISPSTIYRKRQHWEEKRQVAERETRALAMADTQTDACQSVA